MTEFIDENTGKIFVNVATELFKSVYKGASDKVKGKAKEFDLLNTSARKYAKKMYERYNVVRIFGMSEPVPLENLYVRAYILEKITDRIKISPENLEEFYDHDSRRFGKIRETKPANRIVNEYKKFIVLGKPGAGKTTLLKHLVFLNLNDSAAIKERRLPIFITLKDYAKF